MEIILVCGWHIRHFFQTNPDTMYSELKLMASKFGSSNGWEDYSHNIVTFPHHFRKPCFIRFGVIHCRMLLFAACSVAQNTGTVCLECSDLIPNRWYLS